MCMHKKKKKKKKKKKAQATPRTTEPSSMPCSFLRIFHADAKYGTIIYNSIISLKFSAKKLRHRLLSCIRGELIILLLLVTIGDLMSYRKLLQKVLI